MKAPEPTGQISFVSFVRPNLCLLVPTVRIILNSRPANGYLAVSPDWKSMVFTGLWMNKCQRGQQFDPEPGVLGSKGFTWGRVYWEVKVDRIWWEAEEEEETMRYRVGSRGMFGSNDLGGFTGITDGYQLAEFMLTYISTTPKFFLPLSFPSGPRTLLS